MRKISYITQPSSSFGLRSEGGVAEEINGWETDLSSDIKKPKNKQLITLANEKQSLISLLHIHHVDFPIIIYSPSGWTHKGQCPFPDHHDANPSFNYNSIEDRFNCFGCGRSGRAVQFKAAMHNLPMMDVAETIIEQFGSLDEAYLEIKERKEDKSDEALLEFSLYIKAFLDMFYGSSKALEFAEAVAWGLDLYVLKHATNPNINYDNLEARIALLKEKLDDYYE